MSRKEFALLLQQYLSGNCSEQEKEFVEQWFGLLENGSRQELTDAGFDELEPLMWEQIQKKKGFNPAETPYLPPIPRQYPWKMVGRVAAAVLLATLATWLYLGRFSPRSGSMPLSQEMTSGWKSETNSSGEPRWLRLADGSRVQLEPNGSLRYPATFDAGKREVFLSGGAYFDIAHAKSRPFYVHTDEIVTKVLGTSFRIKENRGNRVSVEVLTGKVAVSGKQRGISRVFERGLSGEVVLSPNQKTVYFVQSQEFVKGLVDQPKLLPTTTVPEGEALFSFEEVALGTVLDRLGKAYGIHIELDNKFQQNCPLTADLTNLSLYDQLDMICAATRSKYVVEGTRIRFNGPGCGQS